MWVPTGSDGLLMESEFRSLMRRVAAQGVNGFMVLGTTGEFPHLEIPVRKRVLEVARETSGGLPIMANISDVRPRVVAELGSFCREIGIEAVSILPPYYFPLAQEDLLEFFLRASEASDLPAFLYNFPERVGYKILPETIAAFARRRPLLGVKQSGADFEYHRDLVALGREHSFTVLTGSDTGLPEAMALGVEGVVSGLSNSVGDLVVSTYRQLREGRSRAEIPEAARLSRIGEMLGRMEFPFNVGAVIRARGLPVGLPKMLVSKASQDRYDQLTSDYAELFRGWGMTS